MLTGVHILLTYACTFTCDHCFLYCSPEAEGTMTLPQVRKVLEQARELGTVEWIYFEGGEPFLYSASLVEGVKQARKMGFEVGTVSNGYWAVSEEDAEVCLRPLADLGLADLSISDDAFHYGDLAETPARRALAVAKGLGIPSDSIYIEKPFVEAGPGEGIEPGQPVVGGGAMFRGRAVEKLLDGLPLRRWQELTSCPHEDLESPSRVHVDPYGNVHLCQGLLLGNLWETPLAELVDGYSAAEHPVCGPLTAGGPAALAERYRISPEEGYVDECHFCYLVRRELLDRLPGSLGPAQVYAVS
jgi:hypothetical protein